MTMLKVVEDQEFLADLIDRYQLDLTSRHVFGMGMVRHIYKIQRRFELAGAAEICRAINPYSRASQMTDLDKVIYVA